MTGDPGAKDRARSAVAALVANFRRNEADYLHASYNETQARTDFITPLLEAFGWDVHNSAGYPAGLREVVEEATVEVGPERLNKRPDYELRLARQRKLFVEAKKPSVAIDRNREASFQTRRYGYSASLPISVLTNFHQLAIYDCKSPPVATEEAHVARIALVRYDEFERRFDELWPLISRQAIYSGDFDRRFAVDETRHGAEQFDDFFLRQVRSWRERLAADIHASTPGLTPSELTYAVQLFLSRIVFLRICEDREIERYETLKNLPAERTFDALMGELRRADEFYNSGIFRLLDDQRLGIRISDTVLQGILIELYYPQSPYTFAVVETEVLGEIYEQFLGEEIQVEAGRAVVVSKPEVRESGGVIPTPRYVVDAIVERTLLPALDGRSPEMLANFTVADVCCGSGIFLLSIYEMILDHYLSWYLVNERAAHVGREIFDAGAGQWRLTYVEKRRILCAHVRGVDIDHNAVEIARFSLLLKLIEDEDTASLQEFVQRNRMRALPSLDHVIKSGNSLVSQEEWENLRPPMSAQLQSAVNPFTWEAEFPDEMRRGGFDVIVGNPPYIRIQNMAAYSPQEVAYYRDPASPYLTAHHDNFDKYGLFIERSLSLLGPNGRLGVITPHKFMSTQAGRALRILIAGPRLLEEIVHFGVKQVFGRRAANYTCILVMDKQGADSVRVEHPGRLEEWRYGVSGQITEVPAHSLGEATWQFADTETRLLFERIRVAHPRTLNDLAEIFVGVQTSADDVYIFHSVEETDESIVLRWEGRDWPIERGVLRPCLLDVSLEAFARAQPNAWMIFPYSITERNEAQTATLMQPDEMAARFPQCYAYLNARREELDRRQVTGGRASERQFYQFGRSQSLTKFTAPKIVLPALSLEPRYAYDSANIVVTGGGNGPYYMIRSLVDQRIDDYYLLAILNHPLSEAFVRTNTSTFRGGYYSHGKQFIKHLPVPMPTEAQLSTVQALVADLLQANEALISARIPHERAQHERRLRALKTRVESEVSMIWGLTTEDMDVVRAVPIPA